MEFRIGGRDPVTGLYDVIWPDGGATRNGIKIFNAAHQTGDVVLTTRRSDGMMILDGVKAADVATSTSPLTVSLIPSGAFSSTFGGGGVGYLQGQVWNDEAVVVPTISIDFAPDSLESLREGQGFFVVRVSIDRPQNSDLKFRVDLSGSAEYLVDYTISEDPLEDIVIEAGQWYIDINMSPIIDALYEQIEDITIDLRGSSAYRLGIDHSIVLRILPRRFGYRIYTTTYSQNSPAPEILVVDHEEDETAASRSNYDAVWQSIIAAWPNPTSSSLTYYAADGPIDPPDFTPGLPYGASPVRLMWAGVGAFSGQVSDTYSIDFPSSTGYFYSTYTPPGWVVDPLSTHPVSQSYDAQYLVWLIERQALVNAQLHFRARREEYYL